MKHSTRPQITATDADIRETFPLITLIPGWAFFAIALVLKGVGIWSPDLAPGSFLDVIETIAIIGGFVGATIIIPSVYKIVPRVHRATDGYEFPGTFDYQTSLARHEYMQRLYNPDAQYVYVLRDVDVTGYCKIGRSSALNRRLMEFSVMLPFNIHIVHLIPCDNDVALETMLHRIFEHRRIRGEWFALQDVDIAWLVSDEGLSKKLYAPTDA